MPHRMEWFEQRRVFGTSRYPWASADYRGDGDREFPCPNAEAVMRDYMKLPVHDSWGEERDRGHGYCAVEAGAGVQSAEWS